MLNRTARFFYTTSSETARKALMEMPTKLAISELNITLKHREYVNASRQVLDKIEKCNLPLSASARVSFLVAETVPLTHHAANCMPGNYPLLSHTKQILRGDFGCILPTVTLKPECDKKTPINPHQGTTLTLSLKNFILAIKEHQWFNEQTLKQMYPHLKHHFPEKYGDTLVDAQREMRAYIAESSEAIICVQDLVTMAEIRLRELLLHKQRQQKNPVEEVIIINRPRP